MGFLGVFFNKCDVIFTGRGFLNRLITSSGSLKSGIPGHSSQKPEKQPLGLMGPWQFLANPFKRLMSACPLIMAFPISKL